MSEMQAGIIKELRKQVADLEAERENRRDCSRCERVEAELKVAQELVQDIVNLTAGKFGDD